MTMPLYLHSADVTPCGNPNTCARDHFIPSPPQMQQMAAERVKLQDENMRLRACIAAALERVELLDGGENDGYEAEAILREALNGKGQ